MQQPGNYDAGPRYTWYHTLLGYHKFSGSWAWIIHRLTGIGLIAYIIVHIYAVSTLQKGKEAFDAEMKFFTSPFSFSSGLLEHLCYTTHSMVLESFLSISATARNITKHCITPHVQSESFCWLSWQFLFLVLISAASKLDNTKEIFTWPTRDTDHRLQERHHGSGSGLPASSLL